MRIHPTAHVDIGNHVRWNSGFGNNPVGAALRVIVWVGRGASLKIGNGVGISNATIVATHSVTIGNDVLIGGDSRIYDTDFHPIDPEQRSGRPVAARSAAVTIHDRAFLGAHVTVLKGVTIGADAVIAACSLVTKDVPPAEVWGGNPARFIRMIR